MTFRATVEVAVPPFAMESALVSASVPAFKVPMVPVVEKRLVDDAVVAKKAVVVAAPAFNVVNDEDALAMRPNGMERMPVELSRSASVKIPLVRTENARAPLPPA